MQVEELEELIAGALASLGAVVAEGEEFRDPPLDILTYHQRIARLNFLPVVGRLHAVVAVVRQPIDLGLGGTAELLGRLSRAVHGRFPVRRGATVGLSTIVLTPEPIGPAEDAALADVLSKARRSRVVTLGLFRLNLGQEAMSMALRPAADGLSPEPETLADTLVGRFRRFVPLLEL